MGQEYAAKREGPLRELLWQTQADKAHIYSSNLVQAWGVLWET